MYNELHCRSSYKTWMTWLHSFVAELSDQQKVHARFNPVASNGRRGTAKGQTRRAGTLWGDISRRGRAAEAGWWGGGRRRCPLPETRRTATTEIEKGCQLYAFTPRCNCRGEKAEKMSSCWWQRDVRAHIRTGTHQTPLWVSIVSGCRGHEARWRWWMDERMEREEKIEILWVWKRKRSNFYSSACKEPVWFNEMRCHI